MYGLIHLLLQSLKVILGLNLSACVGTDESLRVPNLTSVPFDQLSSVQIAVFLFFKCHCAGSCDLRVDPQVSN